MKDQGEAVARTAIMILLCFASFSLSAATPATEPSPAPVSEAEFATLVDAVMRDPAALGRHTQILQRLSTEQMARAVTGSGNSHFTWLYPMILRAQDYPALAGTPIGQLSVVAVRGDKLVPIPFQVDEFDNRGLIYIPGVATPSPLNPGFFKRQREPDGVAGVYDSSDELVFMFRDGGLRPANATELAAAKGTRVATLELKREGLPTRYVHVMKGHPGRSSADYVKVDLARGKVQTSLADIEWDPESMAMLRRVAPKVGPSAGQNIVDSVYGEVSTGVLQKDLRFSLNTTNNIRIQPVAVRDGPVRAVMLVKVRIFYMGLPAYHDFINVAMYEQGASLLARLRLDSLDAAKYFINLIKEPRIEATIDFADLKGAEVRWQAQDHLPERAIVDGRMDPIEEQMNNTRLPGDWLWMDSKRGWHFFFSNNFSIEEDGLLQAFLEGMTIRMVYEDNPAATRKGERLPGAGPRFGISTIGMPLAVSSLLMTFRGIDLSKLTGAEDLIDQLILQEEKGKLDRLNQNLDLIHHRLRKEGRISNLEDLANLLVRDVRRMGFRPEDRKKLERLAYRAVTEGGNLDNYRIGHALKAMKQAAKEEGFDFNKLQYAMLDNTLWFPDQVGPDGPAGFDREVRNPPVATLLAP